MSLRMGSHPVVMTALTYRAAANAATMSRCHIDCQWRRAADSKRSAMRL
jgi:hypothetical protein